MRGVSAVADLPDATELRVGEFAKSGRTRRRILESAMECLARHGYKALSVSQVAEAAGLSRATAIYHFPSRRDLVEALIAHVTRRRVDMFEARIKALPADADFLPHAVDVAWEQAHGPEFAAFAELAQASRTDADLAAMFRPAMEAYDRARREVALRILPDNFGRHDDFDLARDILRFLVEGVAQQDAITFNREERLGAIRHFLQLMLSSPEGAALLDRTKRAMRGEGG